MSAQSKGRSEKHALGRRDFLAFFPRIFLGSSLIPFLPLKDSIAQEYKGPATGGKTCWLDVTAPFVIEDNDLGLHSEVLLTSDTFSGSRGYEDGKDETEYQIYLYDSTGKAVGTDGVAARLTVPAMQTTVVKIGDLVGAGRNFFGGMTVRLRPQCRTPLHTSDLFSSAFLRWTTAGSFDNVHANPDPLQWQRADSFFYSMPFPPLTEFDCLYAIFNPYTAQSTGEIALYNSQGKKLKELSFDLGPHSSGLLDLTRGEFVSSVQNGLGRGLDESPRTQETPITTDGGTIAVTNRQGTVKNFGYMLILPKSGRGFTVEHPIHQAPFAPVKTKPPFDASGKLKAKNIFYTPLMFRSKKIGGITLESRFHFSSGAPLEENLWLSPFITDADGKIAWQPSDKNGLPASIAANQIENGAIKLGGQQSCVFDCSQIGLPKGFSGALSLAISPNSNHTLMKVQLTIPEWSVHGFTHFRPGLQSARSYQKPLPRDGLGTDYITCGARLERSGRKVLRDEIIAVVNIDDKAIAGDPNLEIFTSKGLFARIPLGDVPPFAGRHYLLSELVSGKIDGDYMTLRLVDAQATLLMSLVHLDRVRRDIALDHGSDRFSTFQDFTCDV
jgi:hypothetical protein